VSAALALALASCGGSDAKLLPGDTAREIRENLDSVQTLVEEGECVGAEDQALQVSSQVEAVEGIDPNLKRALEEGAARLSEVVEQCEAAPEETVEETVPTTPEKSEAEKAKQEEQREKEEGKQEKEEEKAEKEQEKEAQEGPEGPSLPPQANGKAKGHEEEPPVESGGSGGIGPGGEVEGGG
jgi:hypothetical protein